MKRETSLFGTHLWDGIPSWYLFVVSHICFRSGVDRWLSNSYRIQDKPNRRQKDRPYVVCAITKHFPITLKSQEPSTCQPTKSTKAMILSNLTHKGPMLAATPNQINGNKRAHYGEMCEWSHKSCVSFSWPRASGDPFTEIPKWEDQASSVVTHDLYHAMSLAVEDHAGFRFVLSDFEWNVRRLLLWTVLRCSACWRFHS